MSWRIAVQTLPGPSLELLFTNRSLVDNISGQNLITFTRASSATYVDSNRLIRTAAVNEPRFDHNPATGESLGLLIEEQRTNIIVSTQSFNSGGWNQNGASLTANSAIAPDGSNTATLIASGTGNNRTFHFDNTGAGSKTLTIFAKSNAGNSIGLGGNLSFGANYSATAILNTSDGTVSTATGCSSVAFPNGWYRFIIPISVSYGTGNANYLQLIGPVDSVYIWGAQLEAGAFPTSYIPTTTAAVTRAGDVASITGGNFSSWYRQDEGTINTAFINNGRTEANLVWYFSSGSEAIALFTGNISIGALTVDTTGGRTVELLTRPQIANGKNAFAYKQNNFAFVQNGGAASTDTAGNTPTALTSFTFASLSGSYALNGTIARLTYWPTRLPNPMLQRLTQ